jgi:hypothetical protein
LKSPTLRLPEGTVKSQINRGRTELARQIKAAGRRGRTRIGPEGIGARFGFKHGSLLMNVTTDQAGRVSIVRVGETRLMYPILTDFATAVSALVAAGKNEIIIDLTPVTYVDSPASVA